MHLTSSPLDWYIARAGGVVAYVLLSAVVALGLTMTGKKSMQRWPRFAMEDVHRFGDPRGDVRGHPHRVGRDRLVSPLLDRVARRAVGGQVPAHMDGPGHRRRRAPPGPRVHEPLPQPPHLLRLLAEGALRELRRVDRGDAARPRERHRPQHSLAARDLCDRRWHRLRTDRVARAAQSPTRRGRCALRPRPRRGWPSCWWSCWPSGRCASARSRGTRPGSRTT